MEPSQYNLHAPETAGDKSASHVAELPLTGAANQIEWDERIRRNVMVEFDRVAKALLLTAETRTGRRQRNAQLALTILSDKRADVLANDRAGYYIQAWRESDGKVRQMITEDPRYALIRESRVAPWFSMDDPHSGEADR
jgi:hypothetical protein